MTVPAALRSPELLPLWRVVHLRLGGGATVRSVSLRALTDPEQHALADLLGLSRLPGPNPTVSMARLDAALAEAGVGDARTVVLAILGELPDRRGDRSRQAEARRELWSWLEMHHVVQSQPVLMNWVRRCQARGLTGGSVATTRAVLADALAVLAALPAGGLQLPVLADRILHDPHALDPGSPVTPFVLSALAVRFDRPFAQSAAERRRLWEQAGISENELSSTVLVAGLRPMGDSALATVLNTWADAAQATVLTLFQLRDLDSLRIAESSVWVVENPTVLELFVRRFGVRCPPCVCISGWPSAAALRLLGALRDVQLRYHGDVDGDGLRIAQHLFTHTAAEPWRLSAADYLSALGDRHGGGLAGRISPTPWDPALAVAMSERGIAVYEEEVADVLAADLKVGLGEPR